MPEKLDAFLRDVAFVKIQADQAEIEVVSKLKDLTPEQFARVPRDVLSGLSAAQYADVVRAVAPEIKLELPQKAPFVATPYTRSWSDYWTWIPTPVAAVLISLIIGILILTTAVYATPLLEWRSYSTAISLPANVAEWPRCHRLTRWTDGCVYRVTTGLSWRNASRSLDLPEIYFRHLNRDVKSDFIPAGSDLVVWRDRFAFQEAR